MSYSMTEPDWPLECECRYDEAHDRIDREDCAIHCDLEDELLPPTSSEIPIKKSAVSEKLDDANAA